MTGYVGVIGPGTQLPPELERDATEVGRLIAEAGCILVCGGHGGVMAAAARGAQLADGVTVGLLPGTDQSGANPYLTVALPTGLGEIRNTLIVRSCDALIAVGCGWGTLSEISFAVKTGVPVFALHGWNLPNDGPVRVDGPEQAVALALRAVG